MDTSTIAFVVIGIAGIAVVAMMLRSKGQVSTQKKAASTTKTSAAKPGIANKPRPPPKNRYKATSITCGEKCCAAVQAIKDKRFLVIDNDIPTIPLPNCDAKKCTCVYAHHEDRRDEENDRRGPRGLRTDLHSYDRESERRNKRGRRKTDWE